ncbi:MAG: ABC transporter substrate-binding protein [Parvibaculum sp.]|uniref:substrate-binding periplasmic protein n=1 Tax=Parvibaculum sp. TaxID=2024848 RepID=UPI00349FEBFA
MKARTRRVLAHFLVAALFCSIAACDDYPKDPEGTFDRVRGGTLRAGLMENPPWAMREEGRPSGIEVRLVEDLAASLNAHVEWADGTGSQALHALKEHRLDLVVGGLLETDPWVAKVGFTRPYVPDKKHVVAVPGGENAWLIAVDRFMAQHGPRVVAEFQEAAK